MVACVLFRGSHKDRAIKAHNALNKDADVTLFEELDPSTYDEADAVDLVLKAGQISLHDVFLLHGSEANTSPNPRRGLTMRFMPTTSLFDREIAAADAKARNIVDHSMRPVYLMRGMDQHGGNQLIPR
jgi:ectoine hydroxylase-related dioxygenase (phytanoyl-CoA dioxygenase family)